MGELAGKLNQFGPPKRTSMKWRRVWSVFKYNRKRKRSEHSEHNFHESNALEPSTRDPIVSQPIRKRIARGKSKASKTSSVRRGDSSNEGNSHLSFETTAFRDFTTTS